MVGVETRNFGSLVVLHLDGRLVVGETKTLCDAVHSLADVRTLVLDLTRVNIIDAAGLGVLLRLLATTRSKGIDLKIINLNGKLKQLFEVSCLDSVFEILSEAKQVQEPSLRGQ